jgi:GNAT superfamily N-acetyltransferase
MPTVTARQNVSIKRWAEVADRERLLSAIDEVFFEAALKKAFADQAERDAFRERWLGRYLEHDPRWAYLALDGDRVAGYLVGSAEDPAKAERFGDIAVPEFARFTGDYPAHLHVNLGPDYRNQGLGGRLIAAFAADLARAGVPGVHVITGLSARNVAFYQRHALVELARAKLGLHEIILLGRQLGAKDIPVQDTA